MVAGAFEGDEPPQWQVFARRLSFALAALDPKFGETINIGLRSPLGTWITIQVKNDGIHLVLPGRPFATADAAQQASRARLQEVGWEPLDEQHWGHHVPQRFASRHAINGVVTAFRLFEAEDPTRITYRAYVSGPLRNRPRELPELMLEPTRPEITDSFQPDAPALGTGALPRMDQEFVAELLAEPQLEPETRDWV